MKNAADEIVSNEGAVKQTMQRLIDSIKRRERCYGKLMVINGPKRLNFLGIGKGRIRDDAV